ncbi:MAG: hypothetical protein EHM23_10000, partial [Acidobacteria bacterium]
MRARLLAALIICLPTLAVVPQTASQSITIDYPLQGSVFPPDMAPPTFLWRDSKPTSAGPWLIDIDFPDHSPGLRQETSGPPLQIGEIDPRCISDTNELPKLTPEQNGTRTWTPDTQTWERIKKQALGKVATVTIRRLYDPVPSDFGQVTIRVSRDPVGAPIFYRDVPLMPTETEKGVIKPIVPSALPLIAWRLRHVSETRSPVLMERLATCANCHSFSKDGRTLGMDLDGPRNDKSMYAIASVSPRMAIRTEDVIAWSSFPGLLPGHPTIA